MIHYALGRIDYSCSQTPLSVIQKLIPDSWIIGSNSMPGIYKVCVESETPFLKIDIPKDLKNMNLIIKFWWYDNAINTVIQQTLFYDCEIFKTNHASDKEVIEAGLAPGVKVFGDYFITSHGSDILDTSHLVLNMPYGIASDILCDFGIAKGWQITDVESIAGQIVPPHYPRRYTWLNDNLIKNLSIKDRIKVFLKLQWKEIRSRRIC